MKQNEIFKAGQKVVVFDKTLWTESVIIERESEYFYRVKLKEGDIQREESVIDLDIYSAEDKQDIIEDIKNRICHYELAIKRLEQTA